MKRPTRKKSLTNFILGLSAALALLLGGLALSAGSAAAGSAQDSKESSADSTTAAPADAAAQTVEIENGQVVFRDPLDDSPLDIPLPEGDELTDGVKEFHQTGVDPYDGDEAARAAGKKIYLQWCQACHLPDGSGRLGPSLIDDQHNYERTGTDVGMFEMIWAGGLGAMQSFSTRLTQDEILQVVAHINELKEAATP